MIAWAMNMGFGASGVVAPVGGAFANSPSMSVSAVLCMVMAVLIGVVSG